MLNDCLLDHSLGIPFGLDLLSVHDFVKIILHIYVNNSSFICAYVDFIFFREPSDPEEVGSNSYLKAEEKAKSTILV